MSKNDLVEVTADLLSDTLPKMYVISDGKRTVTVPKSLVDYDVHDGTFTMPEWLAKDRGLI